MIFTMREVFMSGENRQIVSDEEVDAICTSALNDALQMREEDPGGQENARMFVQDMFEEHTEDFRWQLGVLHTCMVSVALHSSVGSLRMREGQALLDDRALMESIDMVGQAKTYLTMADWGRAVISEILLLWVKIGLIGDLPCPIE